ncbi:hypothetical protein B0T22DRAFT_481390 [Podospora appendiculata]|uniref:Uncharacterized protein n=1 Tax=Podospora appendiculata TaxID=314037 RepID=A0AAE1CE09_9PEZI|nr:hypothetical protein B0T22DRAFT_481390 [Podospora appendiculata]
MTSSHTKHFQEIVFYNPLVAAGPSPASRGLLVRKGDPAPFLPPPPQQDAHDSRHGGAGKSQDNAILIPDGEPDDDFDDGRSDTSFASLDELVAAASKKLKSSGVAGESRDTVPDDSDVSGPSVTSGPGPDDEFANEQQQR